MEPAAAGPWKGIARVPVGADVTVRRAAPPPPQPGTCARGRRCIAGPLTCAGGLLSAGDRQAAPHPLACRRAKVPGCGICFQLLSLLCNGFP